MLVRLLATRRQEPQRSCRIDPSLWGTSLCNPKRGQVPFWQMRLGHSHTVHRCWEGWVLVMYSQFGCRWWLWGLRRKRWAGGNADAGAAVPAASTERRWQHIRRGAGPGSGYDGGNGEREGNSRISCRRRRRREPLLAAHDIITSLSMSGGMRS